MIIYRKPTVSEISAIQNITKAEVDSGIILIRNDNDVATNIRSYTVAVQDETIIACIALHIHTSTLAEVRSLAVLKQYRGEGIGQALMKQITTEANSLHLKQVFTLTYESAFFEKAGFHVIPKESLPEQKIWADCIKCQHFPVCNEIALIKTL